MYRFPVTGDYRIDTRDGRQLQCRTLAYDPDRRVLRLQGPDRDEYTISVVEIERVLLRRERLWRAVAITIGATLLGGGVGGWLGRLLTTLALPDAGVVGLTLGVLAGGVAVWFLRDRPWLWRWDIVFARPAA